MFFGEFEYRLDEKGRVPIPPRMRPSFKDGLVLWPGTEKCLNIYTPAEWKKLADTIAGSNLPASKVRSINRAIFASAYQLSMDGQGRISLPSGLRAYAGIGDEIIIAGVNNYLELWSKTTWEIERQASLAQAWQIIESMERR